MYSWLTAKVMAASETRSQPQRAMVCRLSYLTVEIMPDDTGRSFLRADHGHLNAALTILRTSPSPDRTHSQHVHLDLKTAKQSNCLVITVQHIGQRFVLRRRAHDAQTATAPGRGDRARRRRVDGRAESQQFLARVRALSQVASGPGRLRAHRSYWRHVWHSVCDI